MGLRVTLTSFGNESQVRLACQTAFGRFAELDDVMSDYRPGSELMRLCARAGSGPVGVSRDLFKVLARANEFSELSEGAFDVTCGPLTHLWRAARKRETLPSPDEIERTRTRCGYENLILREDAGTAELALPGMILDLGGIGKGYACDEALTILEKHGVTSAMVEAGGDIAVSGPPPGRGGWRIGIEDRSAGFGPQSVLADSIRLSGWAEDRHTGCGLKPALPLVLSWCAISTSGDAEQHLDADGKRYSHVVDPRTGYGLVGAPQVTVVAGDAMTADCLAKVCGILGMEKATPILECYGARSI